MDLPFAFVFCGRFKWRMHDISSADLENAPSGVSDRWFIRSMMGFFSLLLYHKLNFHNILSAFSFQPEDIKVAVQDFKTHFDQNKLKTDWNITRKRKV